MEDKFNSGSKHLPSHFLSVHIPEVRKFPVGAGGRLRMAEQLHSNIMSDDGETKPQTSKLVHPTPTANHS